MLGSASVACRMCAMKVRERTSCDPARATKVSLRFAATGLRQIEGAPSASKVPMPTPSGWLSLSRMRLAGASSSQKVAWTSCCPPLMPKSLHIARW